MIRPACAPARSLARSRPGLAAGNAQLPAGQRGSVPAAPACCSGPRLPGKRGRGWCPFPQRALACRGAGCTAVSLQGRGPRCLRGDPGCRSPSERSLHFPFHIPVLCRSAWVSFPAAFGQAALVVAMGTRWQQGTGWACFLLPVPTA